MLIFSQPNFLWMLLLVPAIPAVYAVTRSLRRKRLRRLGQEDLVKQLMPSWSGAKGWWRIILFTLAFTFFTLGIARPQLGAKLAHKETHGAEIMICLDVSNSMLAQDYSPDRLSRAKLAISRMVDKLQEDRLGLIIFAGSSFVQIPITTDYVSAKLFLSSISTESIPVQGTAMGDAILTAAKSFSAQSEKSRAIVVITDGENHEDDAVEAARQVAETGIRIYTIGVGSLRGQPIPKDGELMKDKSGEIVVTRLDEETLKQVAAAGNGAYVHAGNDEFGLTPVLNDLKRLEDEKLNSVVFEEYDEQYMYFFAIALFFLVLETLVGERRPKKKLFTILLALAVMMPAANAQTDKREVRAGNRKFKKENYKEAEIDYRKAVVKDSLSVAGQYNLASALYRQQDFEGAGKALDAIQSVAISPDYFYNQGDVALQKQDYSAAVDAFTKALLLNPGDMDAKENYIYAKKMMKDQKGGQNQNQNQNQNQDQDQDQNQNQDQNQDQNQQPQISKQQAQQMLNAIQAKEKDTQDKVKEEMAKVLKSKQKEKNW